MALVDRRDFGVGLISCGQEDWPKPAWKSVIPVAALDTGELLDHIPQGQWSAPKPYHWLDQPEKMQGKTDYFISDWVVFLNNAKKGHELAEKFFTEKTVEINGYASTMFLHFMEVSSHMGKKEMEERLELLASVKRGFLALLSGDAKVKLGEKQPEEKISQEDIANTRKFVAIVERIPTPLPPGFRLP